MLNDFGFSSHRESTTLFTLVEGRQMHVTVLAQGQPGEDGVSILAALERDVLFKHHFHLRETGQLSGLIHTVAASWLCDPLPAGPRRQGKRIESLWQCASGPAFDQHLRSGARCNKGHECEKASLPLSQSPRRKHQCQR